MRHGVIVHPITLGLHDFELKSESAGVTIVAYKSGTSEVLQDVWLQGDEAWQLLDGIEAIYDCNDEAKADIIAWNLLDHYVDLTTHRGALG